MRSFKAVPWLVASILSFSALSASATVQKLLRITNDRNATVSEMGIILHNPSMAVEGMRYAYYEANGKVTEKTYTVAQLTSAQGVVLEEERGVKAITLQGTLDEANGTGEWMLRYVANGLSKEYKDCPISLRRSPAGAWTLVKPGTSRTISDAHVVTWSLGIRTIQGLCD